MRTLLFFASIPIVPALHASVILTGTPVLASPITNCANTSFSAGIALAPTANGFSATGTVSLQLSGPTGPPCSISWSAAAPVQLTTGAFTIDGTIDASLSLPTNAPSATFFASTVLQGFPPVDTTLVIGNGQHLTAFNEAAFPAVPGGGSFLSQQVNVSVCPCLNGGTISFHIPISAGIVDVPEPESATLLLLPTLLLTWSQRKRFMFRVT